MFLSKILGAGERWAKQRGDEVIREMQGYAALFR
jgi:hypothetical protein